MFERERVREGEDVSESVKERAYKCVRVSARVRENERQSEEAESRPQE